MSRTFGRNLEALRTQSGMTLAELAQVIGCHPSFLSHMERGRRLPPKYRAIMQMADVFEASREQRLQLWDAAIWTVAANGIEHLDGIGDAQVEAFLQRMSHPEQLNAVRLAMYQAKSEIGSE